MSEIDRRPPYERLREARAKFFPSGRAAAKRHRWSDSTYGAHENGTRKFGLKSAERYGKAFRVNPFWLMFGTEDLSAAAIEDFVEASPADETLEAATIGRETGKRGIPAEAVPQIDVTGGMGGGGLTLVSDGVPGRHGLTFSAEHVRGYWLVPPEVLSSLFARPEDVAAFAVQGDSMSPTLDEGDIVFIDTRHRLPSPPGIYAITDDFGGLVVKRLEVVSRPHDEETLVQVISDNPRHAARTVPLSDLYIVGRVMRRFGLI